MENISASSNIKDYPSLETSLDWELTCADLLRKHTAGLVTNNATYVVSIIPTYQELHNGNFVRFLKSLTRQSVESLQRSEVIFSINNSKKDATNRTTAYLENQEQIRVIGIIQKLILLYKETGEIDQALIAQLSKLFTEIDVQTIVRVVKLLPNINYVNLSTLNNAIDVESAGNPRGIAKDIAGKIAYLKLNDKRGFIDFLDGDCTLNHFYYEGLISEVGIKRFLVKPLYTLPSLPEAKYDNPLLQFYNTIAYYRHEYLSAEVMYLGGKRTYFNTPSQCITGEAFKDIGGYPADVPNEDYKFATRYSSLFPNEKPKDVKVRVNLFHRGREGSVDGKHISLISEGIEINNLQDLEDNLSELTLENRMILKDLARLNAEYEKHPLYLSFRKEEYRKEKIKRHFALKLSSDCIADFLSGKLDDFSNRLSKIGFTPNQIALILETLQFVTDNYFYKNENLSQINLLTKLSELLPEFLQPMSEQEPDYTQLTQLTIKYRSISPKMNVGDFMHIASAYNRFRATLD